jgi:hypothetical protein
MKITYKPISTYLTSPYHNIFTGYKPIIISTTICCDEMARNLNNVILYKDISIRLKSSSPDTVACGSDCYIRLFIKDSSGITYCPFCGEKIEFYRSGKYLDNAEKTPDPLVEEHG